MGLSHEKTGYSTFNIDVQFGKPDYAISFMGLLSTMCQNSKQIGSTVVRTGSRYIYSFEIFISVLKSKKQEEFLPTVDQFPYQKAPLLVCVVIETLTP